MKITTVEDAIEEACKIVWMVYVTIGDYSEPSDGFCSKCPTAGGEWTFHNSGRTLEYVRAAVIEKLERDGHTVVQVY